ncbi:hypothetical protein B7463_g4528, partial [Scytalidium lignicola]
MQNIQSVVASWEPTFQRGWTFQELLLSPRVLMFDSYQITLKCREHNFRPVIETWMPLEIDCLDLPVSVYGLEDEELARRKTVEAKEDYLKATQGYIWERIIHEYSERDLTLFNDRLSALAGIAAELAKAWNDIYLAGFWGKTIIQHLGWQRQGFKTLRGVDSTKRIGAPSWSWVTVPYPVLIKKPLQSEAKLVGSGIQPVSLKSPFGQVEAALIVLKTWILKASDLVESNYWPLFPQNEISTFVFDFEDPKPEIEHCKLVYLGRTGDLGQFLIVEKSQDKRFQRVGYANLYKWERKWENYLFSTKSEIIVLE